MDLKLKEKIKSNNGIILNLIITLGIVLLAGRVFICEQVFSVLGIVFNQIFLVVFLLFFIVNKKVEWTKNIKISIFMVYVWLITASFFSVNVYDTQRALLDMFTLGAIFLFVLSIGPKQQKFLIKTIIIVSFVVAFRASYQYLSGFKLTRALLSKLSAAQTGVYASELLQQKRAVAWFTTPNLLASYLLIFFPLTLSNLNFNSKNSLSLKNIFWFTGFVVLVAAILFTKVIAGYFIIIFLTIFYGFNNATNKNWLRQKSIFLLIAAGFLVFGGIFLKQRANAFLINGMDNSLMQRIYYWQSALKIIKHNFIFGVGLGNFGVVYPFYKNIFANETIYAHNSFLQLFAESGIMIFILSLCLLGMSLINLFKKEGQKLKLALLYSSAAFLMHNLFSYSFFVMQVCFTWIIVLACYFSKSKCKKSENILSNVKVINFSFVFFLGVIVLVIAFNSLLLVSELKIKQGINYAQEGKHEKAAVELGQAVKLMPYNDGIYNLMALNLQAKFKNNFSNDIVSLYKKAIYYNPHYAFYYFYLGEYYKKFQFNKLAQHYFCKALDFYPHNRKFELELKSVSP